jgi:hypothetical protein
LGGAEEGEVRNKPGLPLFLHLREREGRGKSLRFFFVAIKEIYFRTVYYMDGLDKLSSGATAFIDAQTGNMVSI